LPAGRKNVLPVRLVLRERACRQATRPPDRTDGTDHMITQIVRYGIPRHADP